MNIIIPSGVFILMLASLQLSKTTVKKLAAHKVVSPYRTKYITKIINFALILFYSVIILSTLGIEYSHVAIFLSSVFAILGVALFAQWSILSNVTASIIIFFAFPYKVGDKIQILNKDFDLSGVIMEISVFHVLIKNKNNEMITYPNTLILQVPVLYIDDKF